MVKKVLSLGFLLIATSASAQQQPPQFDMQIRTTKVAQNIYLIEGAGGNVAAYIWEQGVLLVDDKLAPASADVKAAVASVTSKPIRFVINSHWHRDHSGGNEALASDGSVIVAHENVRKRMSVDGFISVFNRKTTASPPKALPIVTFTNSVTFHLGSETISVIHVDPAHTDGDSFVFFHKANVLHMGDCYLNGSFPVIDSSNGGSFIGTIAAADRALAMLDAGTQIIPGHGPIARRHELREWRTMLNTILERVRIAISSGKNLQQLKAQGVTKEWDIRLPKSFVTSEHVVDEAYRAVTSMKQKVL
jgi:cyclase